jgi:hypothetical protein
MLKRIGENAVIELPFILNDCVRYFLQGHNIFGKYPFE